jgi:hypothetical protein
VAARVREALVPQPRSRKLTIVAQDPAVKGADGEILTAEVDVPAEELAPGPWGYRVHVIDYDGSTRTLYKPRESGRGEDADGDERRARLRVLRQ